MNIVNTKQSYSQHSCVFIVIIAIIIHHNHNNLSLHYFCTIKSFHFHFLANIFINNEVGCYLLIMEAIIQKIILNDNNEPHSFTLFYIQGRRKVIIVTCSLESYYFSASHKRNQIPGKTIYLQAYNVWVSNSHSFSLSISGLSFLRSPKHVCLFYVQIFFGGFSSRKKSQISILVFRFQDLFVLLRSHNCSLLLYQLSCFLLYIFARANCFFGLSISGSSVLFTSHKCSSLLYNVLTFSYIFLIERNCLLDAQTFFNAFLNKTDVLVFQSQVLLVLFKSHNCSLFFYLFYQSMHSCSNKITFLYPVFWLFFLLTVLEVLVFQFLIFLNHIIYCCLFLIRVFLHSIMHFCSRKLPLAFKFLIGFS